jgi:hypothetical protein
VADSRCCIVLEEDSRCYTVRVVLGEGRSGSSFAFGFGSAVVGRRCSSRCRRNWRGQRARARERRRGRSRRLEVEGKLEG